MIPVIRKILYCTELSENSDAVFRLVAGIAHQCGAGVTVLHVMEDVPEGSRQLISSEIGTDRWEEMKKQNDAQIEQQKAQMAKMNGLSVEQMNEMQDKQMAQMAKQHGMSVERMKHVMTLQQAQQAQMRIAMMARMNQEGGHPGHGHPGHGHSH